MIAPSSALSKPPICPIPTSRSKRHPHSSCCAQHPQPALASLRRRLLGSSEFFSPPRLRTQAQILQAQLGQICCLEDRSGRMWILSVLELVRPLLLVIFDFHGFACRIQRRCFVWRWLYDLLAGRAKGFHQLLM